jgi:hypothetical protein
VSLATNATCGFGILVADGAANNGCFAKAINVVPSGAAPSEKLFAGAFNSIGCYTDSTTARTLAEGNAVAADMSVEKCVAFAQGFKYAGVELGR